MSARAMFRSCLRGLLAVFAAFWLVLEEWIWDRLTAFTAWVARLPVFRRLEAWIRGVPPYGAMALFLVPWLLLLPAKFAALWLLASGRAGLGIVVFVLAKVVGTLLLTRLFALTRPALLQIRWFRRLYEWFTALRDRVYAYVKALPLYQKVRAKLSAWRQALRAAWRRWRHG